MKIISFIEYEEIISKILKHLGLWDVKRKPPPRANDPPTEAFIIYDESSSPGTDDYLFDADRSTYRLWTGYYLPGKKSYYVQSCKQCSKRSKFSIQSQKINVDKKDRFRYRIG